MSWRDHVLEWLCALGVAAGTLAALHQIESRAAPPEPAAVTEPAPDAPVLGG
jgi:hypothetical protein